MKKLFNIYVLNSLCFEKVSLGKEIFNIYIKRMSKYFGIRKNEKKHANVMQKQ